jgi:hypothetical protein
MQHQGCADAQCGMAKDGGLIGFEYRSKRRAACAAHRCGALVAHVTAATIAMHVRFGGTCRLIRVSGSEGGSRIRDSDGR